jgi:nucleoside-diphosphate-sugar epimerase
MNIGGTQTVAEAVRLSGARRLVHISTFGAYDWRRPVPEPVTENFPRGSGVPYGNFKAAQELILEAYRTVYGFELIMLRLCNVYGVGHFWAGSGGGEKVQDILLAGLTGKPARIPEEQTMAFEYLYAKDVGRAVEIAATCPAPADIVFNIGSGVTTSFDELLATAKSLLPDLNVEIVPGTPPVSREQHLDTTRAREQLGWRPSYGLKEGFADYIEDLRRLVLNRPGA